MKIILVLIICSALNGVCEKGWKKNVEFSDWDSCMRQGYMDSLQLMDVMGSDYVNKNLGELVKDTDLSKFIL